MLNFFVLSGFFYSQPNIIKPGLTKLWEKLWIVFAAKNLHGWTINFPNNSWNRVPKFRGEVGRTLKNNVSNRFVWCILLICSFSARYYLSCHILRQVIYSQSCFINKNKKQKNTSGFCLGQLKKILATKMNVNIGFILESKRRMLFLSYQN